MLHSYETIHIFFKIVNYDANTLDRIVGVIVEDIAIGPEDHGFDFLSYQIGHRLGYFFFSKFGFGQLTCLQKFRSFQFFFGHV